MTVSLGTAYRSFGGEVEASNTPTICRLHRFMPLPTGNWPKFTEKLALRADSFLRPATRCRVRAGHGCAARACGTNPCARADHGLSDNSRRRRCATPVVIGIERSVSAVRGSALRCRQDPLGRPGGIQHRISDRADVRMDAFQVAQHVEVQRGRFQGLRPAFAQALEMPLGGGELGVAQLRLLGDQPAAPH